MHAQNKGQCIKHIQNKQSNKYDPACNRDLTLSWDWVREISECHSLLLIG